MIDNLRIGHGYDIHQLVRGRPCILGGVEIPSDVGLEGHSDADCLTHAIADALLGAAGLPDIGNYFPPADPDYEGIDSQVLLARVLEEVTAAGFSLINIDTTIIAERPRIAPFVSEMKEILAATLNISPSHIGVKATTNESTGSLGRGEAIAAHAVCLLTRST